MKTVLSDGLGLIFDARFGRTSASLRLSICRRQKLMTRLNGYIIIGAAVTYLLLKRCCSFLTALGTEFR